MNKFSKVVNGDFFDNLVGKERQMVPLDLVFDIESLVTRETIIAGEICSEMTDYAGLLIRRYNQEDKDIPVAERTPIKLFINSPGGDIFATMSLVEVIRKSKTPVYTINTAEAMSGACLILINGHKRFTYENAVALIHKGSIVLGGNTSDTEEFMDFYKRYQSNHYKNAIVNTTKISSEFYDEQIRKEWFLNSDEMLEHGLVDEIWGGYINE